MGANEQQFLDKKKTSDDDTSNLWYDRHGWPYQVGSAAQLAVMWAEGEDDKSNWKEDESMLLMFGCKPESDLIYKLHEREWELEGRLCNAKQQLRIAKGLVQIYGARFCDDERRRREMVFDAEAELTEVRRECADLEEQIKLRTSEVNDKDEDTTENRVTREEPPSSPTRSPVTFAGLLVAVQEVTLLKTEIQEIVAELAPSWPQSQVEDIARENRGWIKLETTCRRSSKETRYEMRPLLAGTDARGFRLPPDGARTFKMTAGTDERSFCCPPDLTAG